MSERVQELESALALVNERLAESTERADLAERAVETLTARLRAATVAARESDERYHRMAAQSSADISP